MTKPKQPELKTAADVERTLDEITAFVTSSVKEIEADTEVDLMGIEYTVDHVCEAYSELNDADAARLEKKLKAMVKSLESLAEALKNHPDLAEGSETDFTDDYDDEDDEDYDDDEEDEEEDGDNR